jgi:SAM-dependent methyltransferase
MDRAWLEAAPCPCCGDAPFDVLRSERYPEQASVEAMLGAYRASSDVACWDRVVRCRACGLVRLSPRVRQDLIVDGYRAAEDPTFEEQNQARVETFLRNLRRVLRITALDAADYLDIGSAAGACLVAARRLGLRPTGVEPSRWLAERARRNAEVPVHAVTLEEAHLPSASFDLVSLWDVLEHIPEPGKTLDEIRRLLREGRWLVVSYPAWDSLPRRLMRDRWPFLLSVHLTYFTKETLRRLLLQHGFVVASEFRLWQTLSAEYLARRAAAVVKGLKPLAAGLSATGAGKVGVTYYMGQRVVIARRLGRAG